MLTFTVIWVWPAEPNLKDLDMNIFSWQQGERVHLLLDMVNLRNVLCCYPDILTKLKPAAFTGRQY